MSASAVETKPYIETFDWDPWTEDFRVTVLFNNKQFVVGMLRETVPGYDETNTIEGKWMDELQAVRDDLEKEPKLMGEVAKGIFDLSLPTILGIAPPNENQKLSLHMWLNPETFTFQVVTLKGTPMLVRRMEVFKEMHSKQPLEITEIHAKLPLIPATDIEVVANLFARRVFRVSVNGRDMCCKIGGQFFHDSLQREFDTLHQLLSTQNVQVPRLQGLVKSQEGDLIGLLTEYVHTVKPSLARGIDLQNTPAAQREKWAAQIQSTVRELHNIGVTWGDAKTDNVLIDENGDAWIVDFGGGRTKGWIDQGLSGTPEGDLQGVRKIIDLLLV